jgi:glutathione S-transferase/alpha,alpha-trehalase
MKSPGDASNPHPFKQVPALVDGDAVEIFESGAILMYLCDKYGGEMYDSAEKRAKFGKWVVFANATLDPILFLENERGGVVDTGARGENKRLRALDSILAEREYLVDDVFSVADVAVGSYLLYVPQFFQDVSFARYPNLARYMGRLAMRDAYAKAFTPRVQAYLVDKCVGFVKAANN